MLVLTNLILGQSTDNVPWSCIVISADLQRFVKVFVQLYKTTLCSINWTHLCMKTSQPIRS